MQTACVIKLHSFIKRDFKTKKTNGDLTHTRQYIVWLGTQQSESMMLFTCGCAAEQKEVTDHKGERTQRIYRGQKENQTNTNRHNSLTSRQLVILDTSWAPWQHRMNPARLRSTHTTDSRTNTLTWRWRRGGGGWQKGGREDGLLGFEHLCLNLCAYSVNKTCNKQGVVKQWETVTKPFQEAEM